MNAPAIERPDFSQRNPLTPNCSCAWFYSLDPCAWRLSSLFFDTDHEPTILLRLSSWFLLPFSFLFPFCWTRRSLLESNAYIRAKLPCNWVVEGKAETVQTSHLLRRSDTGIHRLSPQFLESRSNPSSMLLHLLIIAFIRSADNESPTAPSQLLLLVSFLLRSGAACGHVSHIIDQSSILHYYISVLSHRSSAQQKCLFFSSLSHWFFEMRFNSFFWFSFLQPWWKCRGCWSWSKEIQFPTAVHKSAASAASTTSLLWSRVALTFTHVSNTNNLYNAVAA
jgi:hypothetical protein